MFSKFSKSSWRGFNSNVHAVHVWVVVWSLACRQLDGWFTGFLWMFKLAESSDWTLNYSDATRNNNSGQSFPKHILMWQSSDWLSLWNDCHFPTIQIPWSPIRAISLNPNKNKVSGHWHKWWHYSNKKLLCPSKCFCKDKYLVAMLKN